MVLLTLRKKALYFVVWRDGKLNKSITFLEYFQASLLPSSSRKKKKIQMLERTEVGVRNMGRRIVFDWSMRKINTLENLTLRRLMSYIYGAPILGVSRSHTTTQHSR